MATADEDPRTDSVVGLEPQPVVLSPEEELFQRQLCEKWWWEGIATAVSKLHELVEPGCTIEARPPLPGDEGFSLYRLNWYDEDGEGYHDQYLSVLVRYAFKATCWYPEQWTPEHVVALLSWILYGFADRLICQRAAGLTETGPS